MLRVQGKSQEDWTDVRPQPPAFDVETFILARTALGLWLWTHPNEPRNRLNLRAIFLPDCARLGRFAQRFMDLTNYGNGAPWFASETWVFVRQTSLQRQRPRRVSETAVIASRSSKRAQKRRPYPALERLLQPRTTSWRLATSRPSADLMQVQRLDLLQAPEQFRLVGIFDDDRYLRPKR